MATIKEFTAANLKPLGEELRAALKAVGDKHGISFGLGKITYSPDSFGAKIEAVLGTVEEGVDPKWIRDFNSYCTGMGLKKEHLNATILMRGKEYTVVGARPKAEKDVVLRNDQGKFVVMKAVDVSRYL